MLKGISHQFFKIFSFSIILEAIIISLFSITIPKTNTFIWQLIAIAALYALVFGAVYPLIWQYSSFRPFINVLISTSLLLPAMAAVLYLIHPSLLTILTLSRWLMITTATLFAHTIIYVIMSRRANKKLVNELNSLISK